MRFGSTLKGVVGLGLSSPLGLKAGAELTTRVKSQMHWKRTQQYSRF